MYKWSEAMRQGKLDILNIIILGGTGVSCFFPPYSVLSCVIGAVCILALIWLIYSNLAEDEVDSPIEYEPWMGKCPGCQREGLHKMCPAWGTIYYMSGIPLPAEITRHSDPRAQELWDKQQSNKEK
jgi:hypothetical protein